MTSINTYTQYGEEFLGRQAYQDISVTQLTFLLYNQNHGNGGGDNLDETNDVGDITTEVTASSYSRQTATIPDTVTFTAANSDGDGNDEFRVDIDGIVFDLGTDSDEDFDAIGIVANFQSDGVHSGISSDGSATDHLIGAVGIPDRNTNDYSGSVTFDNFGYDHD